MLCASGRLESLLAWPFSGFFDSATTCVHFVAIQSVIPAALLHGFNCAPRVRSRQRRAVSQSTITMAQPHTQAQMAARSMLPAQGSLSPLPSGYPPAKRPQMSLSPSQPGSPYSPAASPAHVQNGASAVSNPHPNGVATPSLSLPQAQFPTASPSPAISPKPASPAMPSLPLPLPLPLPTIATPALPATAAPISLPTSTPTSYTTATMAPIMPASAVTYASTTGSMGPPGKPPTEKPTRELEYDVTDALAGTGIDVRAEEQFLANMFQYDDGRTGFPRYETGGRSSLYGAGPANQPAQSTGTASQGEIEAMAARRAWDEAAGRLAQARAQTLHDPFLNIATLHARAERIVKANGLALNVDAKSTAEGRNPLGRMRNPADASPPTVMVSTKIGPDSAVISTYGSWLPHDVNFADQVALISLATQVRLGNLIGDASVLARNRQTTSHGDVPEEWIRAAAPLRSQTEGMGERRFLKRMFFFSFFFFCFFLF